MAYKKRTGRIGVAAAGREMNSEQRKTKAGRDLAKDWLHRVMTESLADYGEEANTYLFDAVQIFERIIKEQPAAGPWHYTPEVPEREDWYIVVSANGPHRFWARILWSNSSWKIPTQVIAWAEVHTPGVEI
jgi:hypothetical protein